MASRGVIFVLDHVNYTADISAKGVLDIHPKEIERAFQFFDTENQNKITAKDLRKRLQVLYPQIGVKEIKTLLGDGTFTMFCIFVTNKFFCSGQ